MQEVFAVTVLPGRRYPELINDDEKSLENPFVVGGVAARARRTDSKRGALGREREWAARSVRDGVTADFLHQRLFNTRGATEPCVGTE